jgi:hypothetical protein
MSFGKGAAPDGYVVRTFRVKVMATPAKQHRAYNLLVSGGDALAWCIDRFHARIREGLPNANSMEQMWPDQKAHGPFGELMADCAQDVTKAWSAALFETLKRKKKGEQARLPLRKHWVVPVTWRKGRFDLVAPAGGQRARVRLGTAQGHPDLVLALSHDHPYDPGQVRAVRLFGEAGELFIDITAWVAVAKAEVMPLKVAGVDPGIIHPLAIAAGDQALLISGRAVRAEEFLHLEDQKGRQKKMARARFSHKDLCERVLGVSTNGPGSAKRPVDPLVLLGEVDYALAKKPRLLAVCAWLARLSTRRARSSANVARSVPSPAPGRLGQE